MSQYFLRRDVHYAIKGTTAILLDGRTAKYYAVPRSVIEKLLDEPNGIFLDRFTGCSGIDLDFHRLLDLGLLTDSSTRRLLRREAPSDPIDAITPCNRDHPPAIEARQVARFIASWIYVVLKLRTRCLAQLLRDREPVVALFSIDSAAQRDRAREVLQVFEILRAWFYTADNQCLQDSLILSRFLHANGYTPTLVIAVDTRPFCAHAWVQLGRTVVNELLERAHQFTVIRSLRG